MNKWGNWSMATTWINILGLRKADELKFKHERKYCGHVLHDGNDFARVHKLQYRLHRCVLNSRNNQNVFAWLAFHLQCCSEYTTSSCQYNAMCTQPSVVDDELSVAVMAVIAIAADGMQQFLSMYRMLLTQTQYFCVNTATKLVHKRA